MKAETILLTVFGVFAALGMVGVVVGQEITQVWGAIGVALAALGVLTLEIRKLRGRVDELEAGGDAGE